MDEVQITFSFTDVCHHLLDLYAAGKKGAQGGQSKTTKRSKQVGFYSKQNNKVLFQVLPIS